MKACILASGSKGNSTYIETKKYKILLDMGKNKKYIEDSLKTIDVNPKDIDLILISHTHSDHISALDTFIKKYKTTIYMPKEMYESIDYLKDYINVKIYDDIIELDNLKIYAIKSSHDAVASRNFIIEEGNHSIVQITDTGYIKRKYFKLLQNRDAYFIESNHDIEMLEHGPYPDYLKKRVLSDEGHLSNEASGFYLAKLIGNNTKKVYLMHLSEINNTPDIALKTVRKVLDDYEVDFKDIKCADQYEISDVIEV